MDLEYIPCNLCGHDDTVVLFEQRDQLTPCTTQFREVKCKDCGLVYVNPRPPVEDIHAFYPEDFVSYQFEVTPPEHPCLRERLLSFVAKSSALRRVKFVTGLVELNADVKVLDIGCGKGSFLYYLRKTVECRVTGLDFDENSVRYCQEMLGLEALHGDTHALRNVGDKYDLVTMWHYLEHEFDPSSALQQANGLLANGKLLILEVPNAESLENILFKRKSYLYDVPRHLYSFSPTTIKALLERAGFEVQGIHFQYFSGGWIGTVQSILFQGRIYRELKKNIFLFLLLSQFLFPLDYALSKTSRGSVMTVVARKMTNRARGAI